MKPDIKNKKKALKKKISRVEDIKTNADNYRSKGQLEQEIIDQAKIIGKLKKIIDFSSDLLGYDVGKGPEAIFKRATGKSWLKSALENRMELHQSALDRFFVASITLKIYADSLYKRIRYFRDYREAKKEYVIAETEARLLIFFRSKKGYDDNVEKKIEEIEAK